MNLLDSIEPIFDKNGHFYIKHYDHIYEFSIDSKNKLEIFKIFNNENFKFDIIEDNTNNKNLNLLSKCNTLKGKIIKEYIKEKQDNPDIDYESDEELDSNTMENINNKIQYNPEDLEYLDDDEKVHSDDEYFYGTTHTTYESLNIVRYGNIKLRILHEIDNSEINEINGFYYNESNSQQFSGYDTYLYNGNENENELAYVCKTSLFSSSTKLFIYKDGTVVLKILGTLRKRYQLEINKDTNEISLVEKCS